MPLFIADYHLKNFDGWFDLFTSNPPPPLDKWRLLRSTGTSIVHYLTGIGMCKSRPFYQVPALSTAVMRTCTMAFGRAT